MTQFSVLTFNAGLFFIRFGDYILKTPVPYVDCRYRALAAALLESNADILLLQEVFTPAHRQGLVEALKDAYPFVAEEGCARSGLMIFSRHPLSRVEFVPFEEASFLEAWFVTKGFLRAVVDVPGFGSLSLANTHLVSGTLRSPTSRVVEATRRWQIQEVAMFAGVHSGYEAAIVGGDFNAGPEASPENYRQMLDMHQYMDAFHTAQPGVHVTWDALNPLAESGWHNTCPPQRCDHIFLWGSRLRSASCSVVLDTPIVHTHDNRYVPLSDHAGVCATFTWS